MKCFLKTVCALLLFLGAGLLAHAVIMIPLPIEQLAKEAQLVVQGEVLSKTCQRDSEGRIYTQVELAVKEFWKGTHPGKQLTVVHGGGILGDERVVVSGQVDYQLGEEIVAFLIFNKRGEAVTLAMSQGKFHISKDSKDGTLYVHNPVHGASGAAPDKFKSVSAVSGTQRAMMLQDLKAKVQESKR